MILDAVKRERRVAWLLLSNATVDTLQDGILTLRFTREGEAKGFSGSGYDQDLGQVLQRMLGMSPRVRAVAAAAPGGGAAAGASWAGVADAAPDEADERDDLTATGAVAGGQRGSGAGGRASAPGGGRASAPGGGSASGRAGGGSGASGRAAGRSTPDRADAGHGASGRAGAGGGAPGRARSGDAEALTGMDLIQRTLGGEVIEETGDS